MAALSSPSLPPIHYKSPPASHPPAVPAFCHSYYSTYSPSSYSPLGRPHPPPPGSPASLRLRLEEAQLQLRSLERERKRAEAALAKQHPGLPLLANTLLQGGPRLPPRPSRLDQLLVDSWREQARVAALLERVARVKGAPLHPGILQGVQGWQKAVLELQGVKRGLVGEVEADTCLTACSKAVRRVR